MRIRPGNKASKVSHSSLIDWFLECVQWLRSDIEILVKYLLRLHLSIWWMSSNQHLFPSTSSEAHKVWYWSDSHGVWPFSKYHSEMIAQVVWWGIKRNCPASFSDFPAPSPEVSSKVLYHSLDSSLSTIIDMSHRFGLSRALCLIISKDSSTLVQDSLGLFSDWFWFWNMLLLNWIQVVSGDTHNQGIKKDLRAQYRQVVVRFRNSASRFCRMALILDVLVAG